MESRVRWASLIVFLVVLSSGCADSTPSASPPMGFTEHLIEGNFNYPFGVQAGDLDNDGDLDLTMPDIFTDNLELKARSALYWFENDGLGAFTRHMVNTEAGFWERHVITDIDGDGLEDIVIPNNRDGGVLWYKNPGTFDPWIRNVVITNLAGNADYTRRLYGIDAADFDGDGDNDLVVSAYNDTFIALLENPGSVNLHLEWAQFNIGDKLGTIRTVDVGDINGDGFLDILVASEGVDTTVTPLTDTDPINHGSYVTWFENPDGLLPKGLWTSIINNDQFQWERNDVDTTTRANAHGSLVDMDLDSDLDILMPSGLRDDLVPDSLHKVQWYENVDGSGGSWVVHEIGALAMAFECVGGNLDLDTDIDVVCSAHDFGDRIVIFENLGTAWDMHNLKKPLIAPNQVLLVDVDGDLKLDIVNTSDNGNGDVRRNGEQGLRLWVQEP